MAQDKKDRGGFDDIKSLAISAATLGPVAIGLGIGIKAGFSQIRGNAALGNVFTGGRPDESEMLGRVIGKSNYAMARDALMASRALISNNIQESMSLFAAAAKGDSPQRRALYQAFVAMLNSKALNLNENNIATESSSLLEKIGSEDFEKTIIERIEKSRLEVGKDREKEFIKQLTRAYKSSLELEQGIKSTTPPVPLTRQSLVQLNPVDYRQLGAISGIGSQAHKNFTAVQELLKTKGLAAKSWNISEISDAGGRGVFATLTLQGGGQFDIPLVAIRNKYMQKRGGGFASGGLMMRYGGKSHIVMGSYFDQSTGKILTAEENVLRQLGDTLTDIKGISTRQRRNIAERFHETVYGSQQTLIKTAPEESLIKAYRQRAFLVDVPTKDILNNRIANDPALRGLFDDMTPGPTSLAGDGGISHLYETGFPGGGHTRAGYYSIDDLKVASRPDQWSRRNAILKSNTGINMVSSLGWTDESQVGVRRFKADDSMEAIRVLEGKTQISAPVIYQLPTAGGKGKVFDAKSNSYRFEKELSLMEGTSVGGRVFGHYGDTSVLRVFKDAEGRQHPLLGYLLERFNKEGAFTLTNKEMKDFFKSKGLTSQDFLGYDAGGRPVRFGLNQKLHQGFRIGDISLEEKTNQYMISREFMVKPGQEMKAFGPSFKGLISKAWDMRKVASRNTSIGQDVISYLQTQNPNMKNVERSLLLTSSKQLLRSQTAINQQMLTGASMMLEGKISGTDLKDFLRNVEQKGIGGSKLARRLVAKMASAGVSPKHIAAVVASQYRSTEGISISDIVGRTKMTGLSEAIDKATEVIGIDTLSLDPFGQGVGKPSKMERRTYQGLARHIKTLGIEMGMSPQEIKSMQAEILGNISSRGTQGHKSMLTNRVLQASHRTMSGKDITPLTEFTTNMGMESNIAAKNLSDIEAQYKGRSSPFTNTTGVNLTFDTPNAKAAAMNAFGREQIFLPGTAGMPTLDDFNIKNKAGRRMNYASGYEQSIVNMLSTAKDPHASSEEIAESMRRLQRTIQRGTAESRKQLMFGKVRGSAQATSQSLNLVEFGPRRFKKLTTMAKADKGMSMFMSDVIFFRSVAGLVDSLDHSSKEYEELLDKTRTYIFESTRKRNSGIQGVVTRFPTLGEGHSRFWNVRRAGTIRDQEALLDIGGKNGVRKFLREKLNIRNSRVTVNHLNQFLRSKTDKATQQQFTNLLLKNIRDFQGPGSIYSPMIDGSIEIIDRNGKPNVVDHTFSAFSQMVGDTDGDTVNWTMLLGRGRKFASKALREKTGAKAFMVGELEWVALQKHIESIKKGTEDPKLSPTQKHWGQVIKEIRGKNIGGYSMALDKLRLGLGAYSTDDTLQRQGMAALSILEEMLIKVSKKGGGAATVAEQFARVMGIGKGATVDPVEARRIMEDVSGLKGFTASMSVDLGKLMGTHDSKIDMDKVFDEMFRSFEELRSHGLNNDNINRIQNILKYNEFADPRTLASILDEQGTGKGSLTFGAINAMFGESRSGTEAIDLATNAGRSIKNILANKRIGIPIAIGAGLGLAALGFAGAGYEAKPLAPPGEMPNASIRDTITSGAILGGISNAIDGSPLRAQPSDGFPSVSRNAVNTNATYVEDSLGTRVNMTIDGMSNIPQAKKIISSLGLRSNSMFIQDNRRPITKNQIDSMRED